MPGANRVKLAARLRDSCAEILRRPAMRFIDLSYGMALVLAFGGALGSSCGSGSTRRATPSDGTGGTGRGGTGKGGTGGAAGEEPGGSGGATNTGGTAGTGGVPPGGGVGDDCSKSAP